jgi:Fe-S-cluster-containing dehydrogenase component
MVIDSGRCIGCYNCFLACRDEHAGNDYRPVAAAQPEAGHKWIEVRVHERGSFPKVKVSYVPVPCQHCTEAPCISASKDGAVYRRADGIVLIDPDKAAGQRNIVSSCPYGAIFWNEAQNLPQKCTFCAHLLDAGSKQPRCAEVCPTNAIVFGDRDGSGSEISKLYARGSVEQLHPEYGTEPLVGYLGLPKRFIAGEIVLAENAQLPAHGIAVALRVGAEVTTVATDNYGDFEFEGLSPNTEYTLSVSHSGYQRREMTLMTRMDINVGSIVLDPLVRDAETRRELS